MNDYRIVDKNLKLVTEKKKHMSTCRLRTDGMYMSAYRNIHNMYHNCCDKIATALPDGLVHAHFIGVVLVHRTDSNRLSNTLRDTRIADEFPIKIKYRCPHID